MCGIWFYLGTMNREAESPETWVQMLKARGPERARTVDISGVGMMGFTRLAINGLNPAGMQPFFAGDVAWICNGEIYNWLSLAEAYDIDVRSGSDCEVLGGLYERFRADGLEPDAFFRALDGVYAIILYDRARSEVVVGRDPYGVRPLYVGRRADHTVFGSELKSLVPLCDSVAPFLPGTFQVYDAGTGKLKRGGRHHSVPTLKVPAFEGLESAAEAVREALTTAVKKRLMTERPVAALLSGGLDSSLVAALTQHELLCAGLPPLKTFSIGMAGSTDLRYARLVAEHIRSDHTEIILTADDFFAAVPAVIHAIESFDTTTVRASVGNWLVAKAIAEQTDCKVVLNGDGSDEVWGSYLYFYNAPGDHAYEEEVTRLLTDIHMFDVLRSDRSISSHGLEPRTPFLDKQFVATARAVATAWRRPLQGKQPEKWLLRRAFEGTGLLPREVLWRQKEAFSDGVSGTEKSWYEIAQEKAAELVGSDWRKTMAAVPAAYEHLPPQTPEQFYYRYIFNTHFGAHYAATNVPYFWMPRWSGAATDPSARTLAVYSGAN